MNPKTQSILVVLSTLVIGIAIGALGSSIFREEKVQQFNRMPRQQRFHKTIEEIVRPTDEQRAALRDALSDHFRKMAAIHEKHQDEIFAIYDSLQSDLATILTEEQRAKLEKELARGHHKLLRNRIEQMTGQLNLNESQRKQIEEIFAKMGEELKVHRKQNKRESRQARQSYFKKMQEEIEAVLTPEQREKYREMRMRPEPRFGRGPFPDNPPMKRR